MHFSNLRLAVSAFFVVALHLLPLTVLVPVSAITAEITPMGIEAYAPTTWDRIDILSPAAFHRRCVDAALPAAVAARCAETIMSRGLGILSVVMERLL